MSNQQNEYIYDDIQLKKRTLTKEEVFRSRRRRERWANQTNRYNTDAGENDEYKDDSLLNLVMGVQQYLKERAQHDSPLRSLQHKLFAYTIKQSARLDQICVWLIVPQAMQGKTAFFLMTPVIPIVILNLLF